MTPKKKPRVRLNDRDHQALGVLADVRAMRLDDAGLLLAHLGGRAEPLGVRTTRDIVARWVRAHLAETHANPRGGLGLVAITHAGARQARQFDDRPPEVPAGLPPWRDLPHDLTVAAVAVHLVTTTGVRWRGLATVRAEQPPGSHLPDGVALTPTGATVACEIERTAKAAERWRDYINWSLSQWDRVAYWTTPSVGKALRSWVATNLVPADAARVGVRDLGGLAR